MDKVPSFRKQEAKFRSVATSEQFNGMQDSVLYDILNLFGTVNEMRADIDDTKEIIAGENLFMQMRIEALEDRLATAQQNQDDLLGQTENRTILLWPSSMYTDSAKSPAAALDPLFGDVTLPFVSKTSKLNVYDSVTGETFIPDSLKVETNLLSSTGVLQQSENNIHFAFDGDESSFWRKSVRTDDTVSSVTMDMLIGLPDDIISNREINGLLLMPYPYGTMDILKLDYRLFGDWTPIPGFSSHGDIIYESVTDVYGNTSQIPVLPACGNTKLIFNPITASEIRIRVRQTKFREDGVARIFSLGYRSVEVVNYKYEKDVASCYTKVQFPGLPNKLICDVQAVLNNVSEIGTAMIQYEFFTLDENDRTSKITKGFPFEIGNGKMLIKSDIHKGTTSPAVRQLRVIYQEKA